MTTMNEEWQKLKGEAQTLRDEIKLKLHLGTMDARDSFQKLEHEVDHLTQKVGHETEAAWTSLVTSLKGVRDQIFSTDKDKAGDKSAEKSEAKPKA